MKTKTKAKPKAKKGTAKTGKAKTRKPNANAVKFGQKAKRTNELAFTKAYLDGKSGKRIRTPKVYLKEAAKRVWG